MSEYVDHVLELMSGWGRISARRMFGGHGLYRDGMMFAIVMDDTLYLKADAATHDRFAAIGSAPFVYQTKRRSIELSYWRAPDECLDDREAMERWCTLAWTAVRNHERGALRRPKTGARRSVPDRPPRKHRPR